MVPRKMNMKMSCKKITIDDRTQGYINKRVKKLEKFLKKVTELIYEVEVCMNKKGKFRVELMVETPYRLYRAEEESESIEGSIDLSVEKIQNQIIKDKDRLKELRERGARSLKKKAVLDENSRFRK